MVLVDGSWQLRGHSSHNGVVSAINVATGKVLDVGALSNYYKGGAQWSLEQQLTSQYSAWKSTHICRLNHDGSAGLMEPKGAVKIFARSEIERNLRYTEYLGDGDSSSFLQVKSSQPYGDKLITKSKCIGHIQKRVGTRLQKCATNIKEKNCLMENH